MAHGDDPDPNLIHAAKLEELLRFYLAALLAGDQGAAESAIRAAPDARLTHADIDAQIIAPALWMVGERWERGEITVADEHVATEITLRVVALQREAERTLRQRPEYRVMLATPAGERHDVALRMAANLLHSSGYDIAPVADAVDAIVKRGALN